MKVRFNCGYDNLKDNNIILSYLQSRNIELVNDNEDFYIHLNDESIEYLNKKKCIVICGENLYSKHNIINLINGKSNFLNKLAKLLVRLSIEIKYKNICPRHIRDFIKSLPIKNKYAIITNKTKSPNTFCLPYLFLINYHKKLLSFNKETCPNNINNKKFCCMILSNLCSMDRIKFAKKLSKYKKVDIYGKSFLTNADNSKLPKTWFENPSFFSQYKFVICFENSYNQEYITEKLANAVLGNTIAIYRGGVNVGDYFNTKSFINYENYNRSYKDMINKIIELDTDDKKYMNFLDQKHLTKRNIENIKNKEKQLYNFLDKVIT